MKRVIAWSNGTVYSEPTVSSGAEVDFSFYLRAYGKLKLLRSGKFSVRLMQNNNVALVGTDLQVILSTITRKDAVSDLAACIEGHRRAMRDVHDPVIIYDGLAPISHFFHSDKRKALS